ncbi:hypothetical protein Nepgr_024915 [Nepenthes gracilis]|uniref:Uncharacterized protein n=1 Tax=Nepenthes gracilis TaxID=150966 RepID=A0AAD3T6U7_NEPGR|nr:hypothetical protein Nepgr_024915 [Nepenthes gracilis]
MKFLAKSAEDLGSPASRHECYDPSLSAKFHSLLTEAITEAAAADPEVDSIPDSHSCVADACFSCYEVDFDADDTKMHSHDEASELVLI